MTPYRLVVFAERQIVKGTGRRQRTTTQGYGYMGWTAVQSFLEARLPGAGSFLYPGLAAVDAAAREYLALPETTSVSIRDNQDRRIYRYVKHANIITQIPELEEVA